MKRIYIFLLILSLVFALGAVAQKQDNSNSSKEKSEISSVAHKAESSPHPESSKVPRVYPIAAGVWYPGQPLPEKAFRYYRIRCWPGCHHDSPYGKYPDEPTSASAPDSTEKSEPTTKK